MQAATLISVTEYLATSYRPDVDYLDGQLVERNVGEFDHSRLQALLFDDYLAFRIENIWLFDPRRNKAYWADAAGVHEAVSGILETAGAPIRLDLTELWA